MEASQAYPFTLGQFFTIWGVKFTSTQLGAYVADAANVLSVYVNGTHVSDPIGYVMKPHDHILVAYGKPGSTRQASTTPSPKASRLCPPDRRAIALRASP
jgi:hypothetical protein